ncbi:MAG: AI-2E family transporter [Xanthobacteraceae bacterium]|nr:AI-2E family transporter [Xanthobacteraceae bacterium]
MRFERQFVFWIAAFLVLVGLLWLLREILLPFVAGAALAYLLDPLANRLTKRGLNRLFAALIILTGFVLVFAGLCMLIVPVLAHQLWAFINHIPGYVQTLQSILSDPNHPWLKGLVGSASGDEWSVGALVNKSVGYLTQLLPSLLTKGEALLSIFSLFVITPVVAFYLLCDWNRVVSAFDQLIPLPQRETVHGLVREIDTAISSYLHGQLTVCVILGCYYAFGLTLAGLSYGFLIGAVSGFLTFIPYVGSLTALIISFGVALAQFFPDWTRIIFVVGVVLVGQFLEGNVLAPKLVGESVGLHPVWLIFALLAFGYLFGFVGLLLAVPLAAAAGVLIRFALQRYRASPLYTGTRPS